MLSYAYLLMQFRTDGNRVPVYVSVDIYSDPTPTTRGGDFYATLATARGENFGEAKQKILDMCSANQAMGWVLHHLRTPR